MAVLRRQVLMGGLASLAALPVALALPNLGRATGARMTIADSQGSVDIPQNPQRVVCFDLALLDILDAFNIPVAGVPTGPKPPYLASYDAQALPKVGTLFEPDFEAVYALNPDLILVGNRSAAKRDDLAALAPTLDLSFDSQDLVGSVFRHTAMIGRIFGIPDKAQSVIATQKTKLAALQAVGRRSGTALFLMASGGRLSAYGPASRFNMLFEAFGLTPAVQVRQAGPHGQVVSHEFILSSNADWIFVLDRDAAVGREGDGARALLDNPLVASSKAAQANHMIYVDAATWYLGGGGIQALDRAMDEVLDAISQG